MNNLPRRLLLGTIFSLATIGVTNALEKPSVSETIVGSDKVFQDVDNTHLENNCSVSTLPTTVKPLLFAQDSRCGECTTSEGARGIYASFKCYHCGTQ